MKSGMVKILESKIHDKHYHSNAGKKWNDEEETLLLEELNKNMGIQLIAKSHNRTTGSINARRRQIAYNLYINNFTMEEIIFKTKLEEDKIMQTIERRQKSPKKCNSITEIKEPFSIETEINQIKIEIKDLKNTINELVKMMNAVYEFEDV